MQKTNDYQESLRLATLEANKAADEQFMALRDQLSQIKDYKADGYVCLSKGMSVQSPGAKMSHKCWTSLLWNIHAAWFPLSLLMRLQMMRMV